MFKKIFGFGKKKNEEIQEESVEELKIEETEEVNEEKIKEDLQDVVEQVQSDLENNEKNIEKEQQTEILEKEQTNCTKIYEIKDEEAIAQDILEEKIEEIEEVEENQTEVQDEQEEMLQQEDQPKKVSLFDRLKQGLTKAKQGITDRVDEVLKSYTKVDEDLLEDLEEVLITADVGVNTTMDIIEKLEDVIRSKKITDPQDVREELKLIIEDILSKDDTKLDASHSPTIILMVGVNGVGKTTTIGKLAHRYKSEGKKVLLAAGDTFRAAAIDQLEVWANRCNVDIIKHQEGADPGAVIFDAIKASKARGVDVLICDTAGRLHNKSNLMNELGKVFKIVDREYPEAKKEVLLVVDATTGQNAVSQAKSFKEVCDITGLALTKLDGTAKGGVILAVKSEVDVPVKLIGVGERMEDLQDFDSKSFVDALFG